MIPGKPPEGREILWFPYWHFKGMQFCVLGERMQSRHIDITCQAVGSRFYPFNLGFRTQTQPLNFLLPGLEGQFLKPVLSFQKAMAQIEGRMTGNPGRQAFHQALIGETVSLIYSPFYWEGRLVDALLNEPVAAEKTDSSVLRLAAHTPGVSIRFVPTLCPACGWDLEGNPDSLALTCRNCKTLWRASGANLKEIPAAFLPDPGQDRVYLPFWRFRTEVRGLDLESFADLAALANLPMVVRPSWKEAAAHFWCPAFKARPENFLKAAVSLTLARPFGGLKRGIPDGAVYPANLPMTEAAQSLKLILAAFMKPRSRMLECIQETTISPRQVVLVYLPFEKGSHEFIQAKLNLAINRAMLSFAKNL